MCCVTTHPQVKGFEAIRGVHLDAEQFSVENDCMTPTFKFKRPQLQKRYQVGVTAHTEMLCFQIIGFIPCTPTYVDCVYMGFAGFKFGC
jgi:hypothetical protein